MKVGSKAKIALAACMTAVVLAGCSGAQAERSGEVDPNGTINVANVAGTPTLDPHATAAEIVWMLSTMPLVYDQLFSLDKEGAPEGRLVDSWSYSDDGRALNLMLRNDVTFRDGTVLDAATVKVNLDRARTLDSPVVKKRMEPVTAVDVVGPHEVRLTLATPTPTIPYVLAECAGFIMHPDLIANGDPAVEADGSGAYSVVSFTPRESLELVRDNDNYWDPDAAGVETVTFQAFADKQSYVNAVVGEQVDLGNYQSYGDAAKGRYHLDVVEVPTGTGVQIVLNSSIAPLAELEVRQAINHAIDRASIVDALMPGSEVTYQHARQGFPAYDPDLEDEYEYDPEKARALLSEAGHSNGIDLGDLLVSQAVVPGTSDAVVEQLAEVGIRVRPIVVDPQAIATQWSEGRNAAMLTFTQTGTEFSAGAATRWGPRFQPEGMPEEFTSTLADAADNRLDDAERAARYQAINRYLVEQAIAVPIVWLDDQWIINARIGGFSAQSDYAGTTSPLAWVPRGLWVTE